MRAMRWTTGLSAIGAALWIASMLACTGTPQAAAGAAVDAGDIGGTVTGASGPEAGVWVIAETNDLPTRFVRIVVTDDAGRFLIPDLPKANYNVWVRGYGLIDSSKTPAAPGAVLTLKSVVAPDARAAAEIYPAGYWLSLLHVPDKSEFDGKGGSGISPNIHNQEDWIRMVKSNGCTPCHQLGTSGTRTIPKEFGVSKAAWERRIESG